MPNPKGGLKWHNRAQVCAPTSATLGARCATPSPAKGNSHRAHGRGDPAPTCRAISAMFAVVVLSCVVAFGDADAATKCVNLSSSSTCTGNSSTNVAGDWTSTCNGINIKGVGVCSSTSSSSAGNTLSSLASSSTADDNRYCYCKMIIPAVSYWVFAMVHASGGNCLSGCTNYCSYFSQDSSAFRAGLFSNFIN
jgi:hypothetical protein